MVIKVEWSYYWVVLLVKRFCIIQGISISCVVIKRLFLFVLSFCSFGIIECIVLLCSQWDTTVELVEVVNILLLYANSKIRSKLFFFSPLKNWADTFMVCLLNCRIMYAWGLFIEYLRYTKCTASKVLYETTLPLVSLNYLGEILVVGLRIKLAPGLWLWHV